MRRFSFTSSGRLGRIVANLFAIGLIALAAHSWPIREYVRALASAQATEEAGAPVSIGHLRYNLFTLEFEADDVAVGAADSVGSVGTSGFVRQAVVDLAWPSVLRGRLAPQRVLVSGVDVAASSPASDVAVDLHGVSLRMVGASGRGLTGRARLDGPASVHAGGRSGALTRLEAEFAFDGHALDLREVLVAAPGIDVTIAGSIADLFGSPPRASLNGTWRGSVPALCATLLSDTAACDAVRKGSVHGLFAIDGALTSPVFRVDGLTSDLVAGAVTPIALDGNAVISAKALEIPRLDLAAFGGKASLRGSVLVGDTSRISGMTVSWRGIDLRALSRSVGRALPLATVVDGEAMVMGDLLRPRTLTVDANARLSAAGGAGVPVTGHVTARLDGGQWTIGVADARIGATSFNGTASSPLFGNREESVKKPLNSQLPTSNSQKESGVGSWKLGVDTPLTGSVVVETTDVHETLGTLRAFGVGDVPPAALSEWQASGTADVRLGGTMGRPSVAGRVTLISSRSVDEPPIVADAEVRLDPAVIEVPSLRADRGSDHVVGSVRYEARTGAIDGEFTATVPDLGSLGEFSGVDEWALRGRATTAGQIAGTTAQPQVHAVVHASDVEVIAGAMPGAGKRATSLGDVVVNVAAGNRIEARLDVPDRRVSVWGTLALEPDWPFDVSVALQDVDLADLVAAGGVATEVTGRVDGTLTVRGHATHRDDLNADLQLRRVEASFAGIPVSLSRPADVRMEGSRLTKVLLETSIDGLPVQLTRNEPGDPLRVLVEGSIPARLSGLPNAPTIAIDALVDEQRIDIRRATAGWEGATVDGTAQVPMWFLDRWLPRRLHGARERDGPPAAARLQVNGLSIAAAARWLPPEVVERFDGALDLVLAAEADAPMLEALRVDGRVERARLETGGVLFEQQGMATLALQDSVATLAGWRWTARGTDLTLSGRSTLDPAALHYEVGAEGDLDLPLVLTFGDDRIGGTARVAMSASGGPQGLSWNGDLELRDGAWVTRRRGVALTDVDARVACAVGRCRVEQFTGQLNGGTIVIDGDLPVPGTTTAARLHAAVRDAGVELPKGTRHDIDADLDLIGDDAPRLTGTLTVWPAAVSDSIVGLANLVSSFQRGGGEPREPRRDAMPAALSRVAVDVRIVTGDNLTFDSHDLQVAATADLRVSGTLAAPQLRGEMATLERGRVFLAGRYWDLETGTISLLEGPRGTDARVAATVSATISKYVVQIRVAGPASQPTLVMTADPPLGQSDVAELVLTGTTSGDLARGGGQQVATLVSTELLTNVGRAIGIDAVRVEQSQSDLSTADLEPVSRLTISKRLTGKFEVIYSQGLSENDDLAWVLVYRPGWQALDLRATIRTSGSEAYEIRQELELGGPPRRATQTPERRRTQPDVSRVDIDGLPPDDAAVLRERLSLRAGNAFSAAQWQRDRESVASYFHDRDRLRVRVRASHALAPDGSYVLNYTIAPGAITRLEVHGYNVSRVTMAALREAWSHVVIEDLLAEEMTDLVRVELASRGYLTAEVTTRFRPLPDEGRLAIVDVAPGVRTRRRSIEFAGLAAIEAADLREAIAGQSLEPRCWLSPALLDEPVAALYHARGYLDARVKTVRAITEDRATLTVHVDEGPPFSVGEITVVGSTSLGEVAARAGLGLAAGAGFTDDALTAALARLRTAYARAGYLDANIESNAVIRTERDVVDVAVTVKEGRQSVLREVRVAGRNATSAQYVARALDVEAGGPVDSVALDEAQQRLYNTGIFRTVDVAVRPIDGVTADAPTRAVEALVTLEERAEYRLRYGVQFGPSTIDSITTANNSAAPGASFDVQRRNVLGQGIVIGGGGVWSTDQYRVRGTASAAMFRGRFVSTTFTVEHANQDRTADNGLEVIDRSARGVLEQRWRFGVVRRVEIAYGFDIDHRRVELLATTAAPLPLRGRFAGLNTTFTYDSRDNRFNARRGMFHTSRVDAGAGWWLSDVAFSRYQLQHFAYVPVGPLTFASGLRFGSVDVDDEREPASLLLYFKTGGGTSVRGYETDALTPGYVLGQPAGGKVLLVLNEEIRVPFAALESFRESPILRRLGVVAFVDAGNTFTGLDTLGFGGLKVGAGAGVRLDTPVAVVRFDLARPLWRPAGSPSMRWYLSIGQAF